MNFHLSSPTNVAFIIFFITALTLSFLFQIFNKKSGKNKRNPPQAKGAWPIIGHLHLLGGSHLPHKVLGAMADTYGPIFTIKLGVRQVLVVSEAEVARLCYTTNDLEFSDRPTTVVSELMGYNYAMFAVAPYGDYWRQVRKIVTLELLSQRRVQMLGYIRVSELRASMKDIYDAWVKKNKDKGNSEVEKFVKVEMKHWFGNLILNIVMRSIAGKRFSLNDKEGIRFQEVVRKFFQLMGAFVVSDFIPFLKGLDIGGYEKAMKVTAKEMDNFLDALLKQHKIERKSGLQKEEVNKVFIDVLISILEGASEDDFPSFDHDTIIKASCLALLVAGSDTSTVTLIWALSLLLNNPKSLEIAQNELDEHVGRDRLVEETDIKSLVYIQAIIKETLRLYPAAPLSVPHQSREDCIVAGYNIPKDTEMYLNLWKMHRDPNIWSYPNEFRPERFLTTQKDVDVKGNHFELMPFGGGRRICPGLTFALQSLHFTMASLLHQFLLKKPSDEPIDMSESFGLTNMKATPLEVLVTPRLSPSMYV